MNRAVFCGLCTLGLFASVARAQTGRGTRHDSAGIEIVVSAVPPANSAWRLSAQPILEIRSSDPSLTLTNVGILLRVGKYLIGTNGPVPAQDGRVVMPTSVLVFDLKGNFVRRIGRKGRGPGEFLGIYRSNGVMPWRGDSLLVTDQTGEMSVVSLDGRFARRFRPRLFSNDPPSGMFADGSIALAQIRYNTQLLVFHISSAGDSLNTIATNLRYYDLHTPVWAAHGSYHAVGNEMFYTRGKQYEVLVYSEGGRLRRILRLAREPRAVTQADRDAVLRPWDSAAKAGRPAGSRPEFADYFPAVETLLTTREGELWLREGGRRINSGAAQWLVLTRYGRCIGTLFTPDGFRVTDVGRDYVLGFRQDSEGEQIVQLYALKRSR